MTDPMPSDEQLMARVAAGDRDAMAGLVQRHQSRAIAVAYRLLGDRALAEDAAQDALVQILRKAERYEPTDRFTTWLYRIIVNRCHDLRRRARTRRAGPLPEDVRAEGVDPSAAMRSREQAERVRAAIDALPQRQRTAVLLGRFEQMSHVQIAEAMGTSVSSVESLIVRAYARLRDELADTWESQNPAAGSDRPMR